MVHEINRKTMVGNISPTANIPVMEATRPRAPRTTAPNLNVTNLDPVTL
jgi:hypothetical protein